MRLPIISAKRVFLTVAVLAFMVYVAVLVFQKSPVYAQVAGNRVPNMLGQYEIYMPNVCHFTNMLDRTVPAVPLCGTPDDTSTTIEITRQSGRIFAGSNPGGFDKFTGYLAPDGTVSIHMFSPTVHEWEHLFVTGTLGIEQGHYVIRGYAHGFGEYPMPPGCDPPAPGCTQPPYPPYMHTFELYIVKR